MLDGEYEYRAQVEILQGGYPDEEKGVTPEDNSWHTSSSPGGSAIYTYYYTDSNTPDNWTGAQKNAQSSQILINAIDSWDVSIDNANNVIVTLQTVVNYIRRGNIRGNPNYSGTWGRDIILAREKGGTPFWSVADNNIGKERDLSGKIVLPSETFILPPGEGLSRGSIYILNHTTGFPETEPYTDEMWAGISFRNNLPADYRPGATWVSGAWQSHNRTQGACSGWQGSGWVEQRTENGGSAANNPPLYNRNGWKNMYKVGENG